MGRNLGFIIETGYRCRSRPSWTPDRHCTEVGFTVVVVVLIVVVVIERCVEVHRVGVGEHVRQIGAGPRWVVAVPARAFHVGPEAALFLFRSEHRRHLAGWRRGPVLQACGLGVGRRFQLGRRCSGEVDVAPLDHRDLAERVVGITLGWRLEQVEDARLAFGRLGIRFCLLVLVGHTSFLSRT